MLYRRVAGLLAGFLMSQLVLSRSDLICLQHDNDDASAAAAAVAHAPDAEHQHGQRHEHHPAPAERPALADCCQAMTTCSANLELSSEGASRFVAAAHASAVAHVAAHRPSRVEAPDPPPPKK